MPKLSAEAMAVLEAVHAAGSKEQPDEPRYRAELRNQPAVARAWAAGRHNPAIAAEIDRFERAATQRLGEEGMAAVLRGFEPGHRQAFRQVARGLAAAQRGRADHDVQRTLEAFRQREQEQQRLRHRHGPRLGW